MFADLFFSFVKRLVDRKDYWVWLQCQTSFEEQIHNLMKSDRWQKLPVNAKETVLAAPDGSQAQALTSLCKTTVYNIARLNEDFIRKNNIRLIIVLQANTLKPGTASQLIKSKIPFLLISNKNNSCPDGSFLQTETPDNIKNIAKKTSYFVTESQYNLQIDEENKISITFDRKSFLEILSRNEISEEEILASNPNLQNKSEDILFRLT